MHPSLRSLGLAAAIAAAASAVTFSAATTFDVQLVKIGVGVPGKPFDDTPPVEADDPQEQPEVVDPDADDKGCGCTADRSEGDASALLLLLAFAGGVPVRMLRARRARLRARHLEGDRTVR